MMLASHTSRIVLATLLALTALTAAGHRTAPGAAAAGDCTVDASMDSEEQAFLVLINSYRAQNGLGALNVSYMLTKASAWKSKDLATNNYFAHDDLSRTWSQRIADCGYGFNTWLGENIAAGYTTAQQVFDAWKASPGHNANMLGANYTTIGIGRYFLQASTYGWYWTTDFGVFSDGWATVADAASPIGASAAPTGTTPAAAATQPPPLAPRRASMREQPAPARGRASSSLHRLAADRWWR
jgi:uncharacterized protein YkwD